MKWFEPSLNDGKYIFVFGNNEGNFHGAGAALEAFKYWGAIYKGKELGRQGQSYGIPTKDKYLNRLSIQEIKNYVDKFIIYSKENSDLVYLVTPIGCGYAGYKVTDMKPLFKKASKNCIFSWD